MLVNARKCPRLRMRGRLTLAGMRAFAFTRAFVQASASALRLCAGARGQAEAKGARRRKGGGPPINLLTLPSTHRCVATTHTHTAPTKKAAKKEEPKDVANSKLIVVFSVHEALQAKFI